MFYIYDLNGVCKCPWIEWDLSDSPECIPDIRLKKSQLHMLNASL